MKKLITLIVTLLAMSLLFAGCDILMLADTALSSTSSSESETEGKCLFSAGLSETITFDDLEITVTDYVFSNVCGNLQGLTEAKDGNVWCTIYVDVKNTSKEEKILRDNISSNYDFGLVYGDGYTYYNTWQDYLDFYDAHYTISPLETLKRVCVSYEVPAEVATNDSSPLRLTFRKNSRSERDYVEWNLR